MAGTRSGELPGHRGGGHPRSLLPRQRRRMDTRTGSRPRHPVEGQLLELAGTERRAPGDSADTTRRPRESDEAGTGMGAAKSERTPGEIEGAYRPLRRTQFAGTPEAQRDAGD